MGSSDRVRFAFRDVVLVADRFDLSASNLAFPLRRDLERVEETTIAELMGAIEQLGLKCHHYQSPRELGDNALRHREDVVLSIFGGQTSRNRMALVPAICETYGLRYLGPDVYGRIICQDKEVSKRLAAQSGVATPRHRLIRREEDLAVIDRFPLPFVVKPLMEGSSIGISQRNLVRSRKEGKTLARELLHGLSQPVLIEEFVKGREVSYCSIEATPQPHWALAEVSVEGQENYFDSHLFDAEEKFFRRLPRRVRTVDELLRESDKRALDALLATIPGYSYCRIDGKLDDGRFVFLELTPDAWIAPRGSFAAAFINKGWDYTEVIAAVLASAGLGPRDLRASGSGIEDRT